MSLKEYVNGIGSCVLRIPFRLGFARDASASALTTVLTNGQWSHQKRGHAFRPSYGTPGQVTIADTGALDPLRMTAGTLLFMGDFEFQKSTQCLLEKRDAGGTNYSFSKTATGVSFYDGTNTRTLAVDLVHKNSIGVSFTNGAIPVVYVDGAPAGSLDAEVSIATDDSAVTIGSTYNNANHCTSPLYDVLVFSRVLSAAEILEVYNRWLLEGNPAQTDQGQMRWLPAPVDPSLGLILRIDGQGNDVSGTGSVVTIVPKLNRARGLTGNAWENHSTPAGCLSVADNLTIRNRTTTSWEFISRIDSTGLTGFARVIDKNNKTLLINGATAWDYRVNYTDGTEFYQTNALGIRPNQLYNRLVHLVITHDDSNPNAVCTMYLNGVPYVLAKTQGRAGAFTGDAGNNLILMNIIGGGRGFDGLMEDLSLYSTVLTQAQVTDLYLRKFARKVLVDHGRYHWPVSTAAKTSGKVGPWTILTGTHRWVDDGTTRGLMTDGAGHVIAAKSGGAFGSWYFKFSRAVDGNSPRFLFVGNEARNMEAGSAANGIDGYRFAFVGGDVRITQVTNKTLITNVINVPTTITAGTRYEFFISRVAGLCTFTLWIRGGIFSTWTQLGSAADIVHQENGGHMAADLDAGDWLSDIKQFQGAMTPTQAGFGS